MAQIRVHAASIYIGGISDTDLPLQIARGRIEPIFARYTFARFDVNGVEWGREAVLRQGCGEVGKFLLA